MAYAIFAATHRPAFWHDVLVQFTNSSRGTLASTLGMVNVLYLLLMLFCLLYGWQENLSGILLLAPAPPAWLANVMRPVQWYQAYSAFSALLVGLVVLQVAHRLADRLPGPRAKPARAIPVALVTMVVAWFRAGDAMPNLRGHPANLTWLGMRMPQGVAYQGESDVAQARQHLASLPSTDHPWLVEFCPSADSLAFRDVEGERVAISQRQFYAGAPDLYVIHQSRFRPEWRGEWMRQKVQAAQIEREQAAGLLLQRAGTERWSVNSGGRAPGEAVLP